MQKSVCRESLSGHSMCKLHARKKKDQYAAVVCSCDVWNGWLYMGAADLFVVVVVVWGMRWLGSGSDVGSGVVRGLSLIWLGELMLWPLIGRVERGTGVLVWLCSIGFLLGALGFGWLSEWCGWPSGVSVLFSRDGAGGFGVLRDSEELLEHVESSHVERVCARVSCKVALKCVLCGIMIWWQDVSFCGGIGESSWTLLLCQSCVAAGLVMLVVFRQVAGVVMCASWLVCCVLVYGSSSMGSQVVTLYTLLLCVLLSWGLYRVSGGGRHFLVLTPSVWVILLFVLSSSHSEE